MPRDIDDIVEAIRTELHPLKPRVHKPQMPRPSSPQKVIKDRIELIKQQAPRLKLPDWRSVRRNALRALPYVRDLESEWPLDIAQQIEPLTSLAGSDPRLDTLQWLCGHGAIVLVEELSARPAATSADGNAHVIAKLLFEAVTGKRASARGLLQSVKRAKRFRDGDNDAAPRIDVRGYFVFRSAE
jgi:hypothetical protein